jgi:hypothetical protein
MQPAITEQDWERFDGFTPTFDHPGLSHDELQYLLGQAYTRFYMRPSFLANYLRISGPRMSALVEALDGRVERWRSRRDGMRVGSTVPASSSV